MKHSIGLIGLLLLSFCAIAEENILMKESQKIENISEKYSSVLMNEHIDPPFSIPLDRPKVTKVKVKKKTKGRPGGDLAVTYTYDIDLQFASEYTAGSYEITITETASNQFLTSAQSIPATTEFNFSINSEENTFVDMPNGNYTFEVAIIDVGEPIGSQNGVDSLSGSFTATTEGRTFWQKIGNFFRKIFS